MNKQVLTIIFLILTCYQVLSNDGSYSTQGHGGAVIPIKNTAISMEKEIITIDVRPEKWAHFTAEYDCTFYFTNTTKKSQTVLIGFPHKLDALVGPDYTNKIYDFVSTPWDIALEDFSFIIDGKEVTFNPLPAEINPDLQEVPAYDVVYSMKVTFQPEEKKIIKNTY